MTRALLLGDCHGNDRFFARGCKEARALGCSHIIQLGDFGFWPHYPEGRGFLKWCADQLNHYQLTGYWLPGNHECYDEIDRQYGNDRTKKHRTRGRLFYLPRGYRWTWDGISFMAVGGAYSIDKDLRVKGKSWWPQETLTDEDVIACTAHGEVDVILSHDAPNGARIPCLEGQNEYMYPESHRNRERLESIVKKTKPRLLVHGHYHERYSDVYAIPTGTNRTGIEWHGVQVEGLGSDWQFDSRSWLVIDTAELKDEWAANAGE